LSCTLDAVVVVRLNYCGDTLAQQQSYDRVGIVEVGTAEICNAKDRLPEKIAPHRLS
jgi:hypothetical protein